MHSVFHVCNERRKSIKLRFGFMQCVWNAITTNLAKLCNLSETSVFAIHGAIANAFTEVIVLNVTWLRLC